MNRQSLLQIYQHSSGEAPKNVIPPDETTNPPVDDSGDASWGLIVPVILLGLFVVGFIICLCRRCLRKKRQRRQSATASLGRFSRSVIGSSTTGISYIHSTTRSTTHLQSNLRVDQALVMPMAPRDQYNQGSQPKLMFYWENGIWKLCPNNVNNARGHLNPLSAMDEMDSSFMSEDVYMDISKIDDVSPEKRLRHVSVNTTNSEDTYSTCQTFDKDTYHVHNNTPATDGDFSVNSMSRPHIQDVVVPSAVPSAELSVSQMTSYPSTLPPSTDASLSSSSLESWEYDDTSFVTSYHDSSFSISRRRWNHQSTVYTTAHGSQGESESSSIPSLPSSILYFHQKMAGNINAGLLERQSRRLGHNEGSVESDYMGHPYPSIVPAVGDDFTNPYMSTPIPHNNARGLLEHESQNAFNDRNMLPSHGGHIRKFMEPKPSDCILDDKRYATPTRVGNGCWV